MSRAASEAATVVGFDSHRFTASHAKPSIDAHRRARPVRGVALASIGSNRNVTAAYCGLDTVRATDRVARLERLSWSNTMHGLLQQQRSIYSPPISIRH